MLLNSDCEGENNHQRNARKVANLGYTISFTFLVIQSYTEKKCYCFDGIGVEINVVETTSVLMNKNQQIIILIILIAVE